MLDCVSFLSFLKRTINKIVTHCDVHPNQMAQQDQRVAQQDQMAQQATESLPEVFSTQQEHDVRRKKALKAGFYQQIGQLKVEKSANSKSNSTGSKKSWSARLIGSDNRRRVLPGM